MSSLDKLENGCEEFRTLSENLDLLINTPDSTRYFSQVFQTGLELVEEHGDGRIQFGRGEKFTGYLGERPHRWFFDLLYKRTWQQDNLKIDYFEYSCNYQDWKHTRFDLVRVRGHLTHERWSRLDAVEIMTRGEGFWTELRSLFELQPQKFSMISRERMLEHVYKF